jgi:hypothetical protein
MTIRPGEVDPTKGLSLDPDIFLEQQARRERAVEMQNAIRPGRTTPIAIRFDQFTLRRLKALAALRNTGYQTLLKEFVVERLYEEEKREGIIEDPPPPSASPRRPPSQPW